MPYEVEHIYKTEHRSLRDARRFVKKASQEFLAPQANRIYYVSPDGSTRELIE